jgi:DNA mismatch repair protein MutS
MALDASTRRNLELTESLRTADVKGSLLGVIDATVTPVGRRLLRQWIGKPLLDAGRINNRLDQVQAFFDDGMWRAEVRQAFTGCRTWNADEPRRQRVGRGASSSCCASRSSAWRRCKR